MKIDSNGQLLWKKVHGNYAGGINQFSGLSKGPNYVIDECWGMMATTGADGTVNGYAMACGTGIEGCDGLPADCAADPRITWRSLIVATDLNGDRVWSRQDNYQWSGVETLGASSSAAEYIFPMAGGKMGVITDEAGGGGFEVLKAPDGQQCTETPSWTNALA